MNRLARFLALLLVLAWAPAAFAQQLIASGSLTTTNSTVAVNPAGANVLTINVSGTYSGTVTFQCDPNGGGTYSSLLATNIADGTTSSTTTSTGSFAVPNVGCLSVQAKMTSYVSGTAAITITRGFVSAKVTIPSFPGGGFTAGDLLYAQTATTIAGLNDVATGQVLASGGVGVAPAYTATPKVTAWCFPAGDTYAARVGTNDFGIYTGGTACAGGTLRFDVSATAVTSGVPVLWPSGTATVPGGAFSAEAGLGFYRNASGRMAVVNDQYNAGSPGMASFDFDGFRLSNDVSLGWTTSNGNPNGARDAFIYHPAAQTIRFDADGASGALTLVDVKGPIATSVAFQSAQKILLQSTSTTATQMATTQTTPPTCSSNCGTSLPTQVGTDTDMIITMGSGGAPTSGFVVSFNSTWAAAPSCVGVMAKTGMAVGKLPMVIVTGTASFTVTTNGVAPATSDVYAFHCMGVQ